MARFNGVGLRKGERADRLSTGGMKQEICL
jgi:hypothetical protein